MSYEPIREALRDCVAELENYRNGLYSDRDNEAAITSAKLALISLSYPQELERIVLKKFVESLDDPPTSMQEEAAVLMKLLLERTAP